VIEANDNVLNWAKAVIEKFAVTSGSNFSIGAKAELSSKLII
jgi:hypothetical protein